MSADLFDPANAPQPTLHARHSDPSTSHDQLARLPTGIIAATVIALLLKHKNGLTSLEMSEISKLPRVSVSPMLKPLESLGHIHRTDERRNRGTVWKIGAAP